MFVPCFRSVATIVVPFVVAMGLAACTTPPAAQRATVPPTLAKGEGADEGYGPLTFNRAGADFYFAQGGQFAPSALAADGAIEIHLKNAPFQVGYNGRQLNLALSQVRESEVSSDPKGYKASRLSGPLTGAREANSDVVFVYSGTKWTDGNVELSDETSMKAAPMAGYARAYQVNALRFVDDTRLSLSNVKGVLHGWMVVYKQGQRAKRDIMPLRLIFD